MVSESFLNFQRLIISIWLSNKNKIKSRYFYIIHKVCFDIHWDGLEFYLHPLILLLLNPVLSSTGWQIVA